MKILKNGNAKDYWEAKAYMIKHGFYDEFVEAIKHQPIEKRQSLVNAVNELRKGNN